MKTIFYQLIILVLGFLLTGGCIYGIGSDNVLNPLAISFTIVLGAFLGLDLAKMIRDTMMLPPGQFAEMNKWRYYIGIAMLGILFIECIWVQSLKIIDLSVSMGVFAFGIMILLGYLISGIQANKIVTGNRT